MTSLHGCWQLELTGAFGKRSWCGNSPWKTGSNVICLLWDFSFWCRGTIWGGRGGGEAEKSASSDFWWMQTLWSKTSQNPFFKKIVFFLFFCTIKLAVGASLGMLFDRILWKVEKSAGEWKDCLLVCPYFSLNLTVSVSVAACLHIRHIP